MSTKGKPSKGKTCEHCQGRFVSYRHEQKFCSTKCSQQSKKKPVLPSKCSCCNALFFPRYNSPTQAAKTCSRECWAKLRSVQYSDGRMKAIAARSLAVRELKYADSKKSKSEAAARRKMAKHKCCSWCFSHMHSNGKFCSNACCVRERAAYKERCRVRDSRPAERTCKGCGCTYGQERPNGTRFCSIRCSERASKKRRRKLLRGAKGESFGTLFVASLYGNRCLHCGCQCVPPSPANAANEATIDHIVPVACGGLHALKNMQLLCRQCNSCKGDRWMDSLCFTYTTHMGANNLHAE